MLFTVEGAGHSMINVEADSSHAAGDKAAKMCGFDNEMAMAATRGFPVFQMTFQNGLIDPATSI